MVHKIMVLANIVITCLIAWMAFGFAEDWTQKKEKRTIQGSNDAGSGNTPSGIRKDRKTLAHYQPIIQKDIFRTKARAENIASFRSAKKEKERKVPLRLKLHGTILVENQEPLAIILDRDTHRQALYAVNESVQGAQISKITHHQVFLKTGGREEILTMSFEDGGVPSVSPTSKPPPAKRKREVRIPGNIKGKMESKGNTRRPLIRPVPRLPRASSSESRNGEAKPAL